MTGSVPEKRVRAVQFGIFSPEEFSRFAVCKVTKTETYNQDGSPVKNGLYDRRMGVMNNDEICESCGQNAYKCQGHFGQLVLYTPIIILGYMQQILYVLRHICLHCSRLIMTPAQIKAKADPKSVNRCPYCETPTTNIAQGKDENKSHKIYSRPKDVAKNDESDVYEIVPATIISIFELIRDEDIPVLGMSLYSRPSSMIMRILPISPPTKRPSTHTDDKAKENDETKALSDIIRQNEILKKKIDAQEPTDTVIKFLTHLINIYLDSGSAGGKVSKKIQSLSHNKKIKGIIDKLGKKDGIFRNHVMGKRVDFCSRSVISPDPLLNINQCGIPLYVAKTWYLEETVNKYNIELLQSMIWRGVSHYPAVTHVKKQKSGTKIAVSNDAMRNTQIVLELGDRVSRQAMNGDTIIFNRQPTLHRMGILGMEIVVFNEKTFRFHPSICPCFNADFDGDEMNAHFIRFPTAIAEAQELMLASRHMISPKYGKPIIGAVQDGLYGIHNLSVAEKISGSRVLDLLYFVPSFNLKRDGATVFGGFKINGSYSGKQVVSAYLYSRLNPPFNYSNGNIRVENGLMLTGIFNKAEMGSENGAFLHAIHNKYGSEEASLFLVTIQRMGIKYNDFRGATISYSDMIVPDEAKKKTREIYVELASLLKKKQTEAERGLLTSGFGRTPGIEYENNANAITGSILGKCGQIVKDYMMKNKYGMNNFAEISMLAGSKGSQTNMGQVVTLVGQNNIGGRRPKYVFEDRSMFHCPHGTEAPEWRGFGDRPYADGLNPVNCWFHCATGRDGLKDKVLKTRETGYTAKKLVKLMEDLVVAYDRSVRTMYGKCIQWNYSGDALAIERTVPHKIELIGLSNAQIDELTKIREEKELLMLYRTLLRQTFLPLSRSIDVQINVQLPCLMRDILMNRGGGKKIGQSVCFNLVKTFTEKIPHLYCGYADVEHFEKSTVILRSQIHYYFASERVVAAGISYETLTELLRFVERKFIQAIITPGEMIGPITAQSIAETGTQLTLNAFHNLASTSQKTGMLEGAPRLDEILRAAKSPKTPYSMIYLKPQFRENKEVARILATQLEFTSIDNLIDNNNIKIISDPYPYDTARSAAWFEDGKEVSDRAIIADYLKNTYGAVPVSGRWVIRIVFNRQIMIRRKIRLSKIATVINSDAKKYHAIHSDDNAAEMVVRITLRQTEIFNQTQVEAEVEKIRGMIVSGIPGISNVEIREGDYLAENSAGEIESKKEFYLDCDGSTIEGILTLPVVDPTRIFTNDIKKAESVLGIEIARRIAYLETAKLLGNSVNPRVIYILQDFMTQSGVIRSIDRAGQRVVADSTISKMSFEETSNHLKDAARKGSIDTMKGSSPNIMMAQPIHGGTGMFELSYRVMSTGLTEKAAIDLLMA